jgi:uncharacterized repeat protein (TIGR03899 family)
MNKIPENSSAQRLTRLLNRNLGTDIEQLKNDKKSQKTTGKIDKNIVHNNDVILPSAIKHQQLAAKGGIVSTALYEKKQPNINQRALKRKQLNEARKQQNVETIMAKAMEYCSESASTEEIDPDWFHQFIQLSEDTSSKMMQALWGRILAGEIAQPGTFSFKSLTILKRMTNKEALSFQHACQLAMTNRKDSANQIMYGYYQKPGLLNFFSIGKKHHLNLSKLQLPYPELLTLMDIELIYHSEIESGELNKGEEIEYSYHGQKVKFTAKRNGIALNYFKFTQTGSELARLIRLTPGKSYLNEIEQFFSPGFIIER